MIQTALSAPSNAALTPWQPASKACQSISILSFKTVQHKTTRTPCWGTPCLPGLAAKCTFQPLEQTVQPEAWWDYITWTDFCLSSWICTEQADSEGCGLCPRSVSQRYTDQLILMGLLMSRLNSVAKVLLLIWAPEAQVQGNINTPSNVLMD